MDHLRECGIDKHIIGYISICMVDVSGFENSDSKIPK